MITVDVKGVLIGVLLIALIVLVVFLIVLISNITDTIKKANAILDGSMSAAGSAKEKMDGVSAAIKDNTAKAKGLARTGAKMAQSLLSKVLK